MADSAVEMPDVIAAFPPGIGSATLIVETEAMETLLAGYRRFRANQWPEQRRLFESLARDGQRPEALVIACVDSRVDPALIFDAAPGQMLTVRNVANLAPPYAPDVAYHGTSAALEFGVRVLKIPRIVVLGHGLCGGVQSLLEGAPANARDFVEPWMSMAAPANNAANAKSLRSPSPTSQLSPGSLNR